MDKGKEIRNYGEYRTHRLVLQAYDRLRPNWDMEAHLIRLKEVWEKHSGIQAPTQEGIEALKQSSQNPKRSQRTRKRLWASGVV